MPEYEPVIGLEIHVQLDTRTKMFCSCALGFGEPPNTRTCPVCLGLPGALPVVNARAIHFGLMIGMAVGSELAERLGVPTAALALDHDGRTVRFGGGLDETEAGALAQRLREALRG